MSEGTIRYAWMNGEFIPWDEAKVHVASCAVTMGSTAFSGMRAYWNETQEQLYIFRADDHLRRLYQGVKLLRMTPRLTPSEFKSVCAELLSRNNYREDLHFMPSIYFEEGQKRIYDYTSDAIDTGMYVVARPRESILGSGRGINACISSWTRISDRAMPPRFKVHANYQNSRLARVQAVVDGYDDAIFLTESGKVSESTGSIVFLLRDGVAITPPVTSGILESITRATVIQLFREVLSVPVVEREVDRTELYIADEVFLCGSGFEVTPIFSVDRYVVGDGKIGDLTAQMQSIYERVVRGEDPRYEDWLLPVYASVPPK